MSERSFSDHGDLSMTEQELTSGFPATVIVDRVKLPASPSGKLEVPLTDEVKSGGAGGSLTLLKILSPKPGKKTQKYTRKGSKITVTKASTSDVLMFDLPVVRSSCFPFRAVRYDEALPDLVKLGRAVDERVYGDIVQGLNKEISRSQSKRKMVRVMLSAMYLLVLFIISMASKNALFTLKLTLPWFVGLFLFGELCFTWLARSSLTTYVKELNSILERKRLVVKFRRGGSCLSFWEGLTLGVVMSHELV